MAKLIRAFARLACLKVVLTSKLESVLEFLTENRVFFVENKENGRVGVDDESLAKRSFLVSEFLEDVRCETKETSLMGFLFKLEGWDIFQPVFARQV